MRYEYLPYAVNPRNPDAVIRAGLKPNVGQRHQVVASLASMSLALQLADTIPGVLYVDAAAGGRRRGLQLFCLACFYFFLPLLQT